MIEESEDKSKRQIKIVDISKEDSTEFTVFLSGMSAAQQALQYATNFEERNTWRKEYMNSMYAYQNLLAKLSDKYLDLDTKKSMFGSPEINIYNQTMTVFMKPDYLSLVPEHTSCTKH